METDILVNGSMETCMDTALFIMLIKVSALGTGSLVNGRFLQLKQIFYRNVKTEFTIIAKVLILLIIWMYTLESFCTAEGTDKEKKSGTMGKAMLAILLEGKMQGKGIYTWPNGGRMFWILATR